MAPLTTPFPLRIFVRSLPTTGAIAPDFQTNFQRDFVATEGFRKIADASEMEHREMKLLRAGGMLPSTIMGPATPVPLRRSSPWGAALKAIPLLRRFLPPAAASPSWPPEPAAAAPAAPGAATATAAAAPAAVAAAEVATSGGTAAAAPAAAAPSPASNSAREQVSVDAALWTGVAVMEEGRVLDAAGFKTPVAGPRGAAACDVQDIDCRGFPTPARGDGYAPDSEASSDTCNFSPVGEYGFTTPAGTGPDGF